MLDMKDETKIEKAEFSNKKYRMTDETLVVKDESGKDHILHRIIRNKDNKKGGWIEHMGNLSENGSCWVADVARVHGNAVVKDDAIVMDGAIVCDYAIVQNSAIVGSNAIVCVHASVCQNAGVYGLAVIKDHACVGGYSYITGRVRISEYAKLLGSIAVTGSAQVSGCARLFGGHAYAQMTVCDNAEISGNIVLDGHVRVMGDVKISGNTVMRGEVCLQGDAVITSNNDYIIFKNHWSSGRYFVWTRSNNMWSVGCFYGTGKELIKKAYEDGKENGRYYKSYVKFVEKLERPGINKNNVFYKIFSKFL